MVLTVLNDLDGSTAPGCADDYFTVRSTGNHLVRKYGIYTPTTPASSGPR